MKNRIIIFSVFIFSCFIHYNSSAQIGYKTNATIHNNALSLKLISGGNVNFNFNSVYDYKNGFTLDIGTIFAIDLVDFDNTTDPSGKLVDGFELYFSSSDSYIYGSGHLTALNLNTIRVKASDFLGFGGATFDGFKDLTEASNPPPGANDPPNGNRLMSYTNGAVVQGGTVASTSTHQVKITYECGITNGKLISAIDPITAMPIKMDQYTVDIEFWLWPTCGGVDCD